MDDQSRGRIKPEADPRLSRSMEFGLAILECFSEERSSLGIADIATLVGISRSTTHRYATTLVVLGYLEQNSKRKYRLARRAAEAGVAATGTLRLRVGALSALEQLREQTRHTVCMGVLDGGRALYLQRLLGHREGQYEVDYHAGIGVPLPLHCTAIGKALLAGLPESDRDRTLREIELTRHAPNTIVSRRGLLDELNRIYGNGFAISDEEYVEGVRSIAVLVDPAPIEQRLAIEVTAPADVCAVRELIADVGPQLRWAAKLISGD